MCISHRCMARMSSLQAYAAQLRILAPLLAPLARSILLRFIHRRRFGCSASGRAAYPIAFSRKKSRPDVTHHVICLERVPARLFGG